MSYKSEYNYGVMISENRYYPDGSTRSEIRRDQSGSQTAGREWDKEGRMIGSFRDDLAGNSFSGGYDGDSGLPVGRHVDVSMMEASVILGTHGGESWENITEYNREKPGTKSSVIYLTDGMKRYEESYWPGTGSNAGKLNVTREYYTNGALFSIASGPFDYSDQHITVYKTNGEILYDGIRSGAPKISREVGKFFKPDNTPPKSD